MLAAPLRCSSSGPSDLEPRFATAATLAGIVDRLEERGWARRREPTIMKLRELTAVWAPQWIESSGPGETSAVAEEGVLEGLERLGNRLLLRINVGGRRRTASLQWDPPPAVGDVETVLLASIGAAMRDLGNLELPTTRTVHR